MFIINAKLQHNQTIADVNEVEKAERRNAITFTRRRFT